MSEWKKYKFSELCDVTRGASPRPIKDFISNEGMPWVKIADATSGESRFIEQTKERIKLEGVEKSKSVFSGDLILSNSATPGLPKFMKIEACIHDGWMLLRNFRGLNKRFAYWLLLHERKNLVMCGNGSVFVNLKTDILKDHEVIIPDEVEQERIADILDSIAEKIELNHQINQTLEAMAQAIFKSWFVDFEPVKAKIAAIEAGEDAEGVTRAAMSAISGKTCEELDQLQAEQPDNYTQLKTTAELFPASMQDSELGEIPKGWEVKKVNEILELAYGKPLKEDVRLPGNIPVYGSNGQIGWHNQKLVDGPGIVVGRKGNPGTVTWVHMHFYPIDTTFYVIPKGSVKSLYYLLYALKKQDLPSLAADSAVPGLNRNIVYMNKIIVPHISTLDLFDVYLNNIHQKIQVNKEQSRVLGSIRDFILPKLLSGELSVEAAKLAEEEG